jgi:hypothetical protein
MKTIKFLMLFTLLSTVFFTSCSDNESIENQAVTQESSALRVLFNQMKRSNNTSGKMAVASETFSSTSEDMSFDFVYPINVSYNNGTVVTVTSFDGLIELLSNENSELYITGIEFPFQMVVGPDNTVITIDSETEFWDVVEDMEIATYDTYVFNDFCFELSFPISFVTSNEQIITVGSQEALFELFSDPNQITVIYDFVYPFNVIVDNQIVVINNIFEFDEISFDCSDTFVCDCPEIYDPVCVTVDNGFTITYSNACFANCVGFTEADFVDCDNNNNNNNNIYLNLGTCFNIEYPVQMMVLGNVLTVNNDSQLLEYLFELPNDASVVFPINVTLPQTGATFTFLNQEIMTETLNEICN